MMGTKNVASRRSRYQVSISNESIRSEDESPTRKKEDVDPSSNFSNTIIYLGFCILLLGIAYIYHRNGPITSKDVDTMSKNVNAASQLRISYGDKDKQQEQKKQQKQQPWKFITIVLPSVVNPTQRRRRLEAIAETWGPSSRAVYVVHNLDVEFPGGKHQSMWPQTLSLPSNITFDDGLPRLYYTLQHTLELYDAEFYFFVNDHTYVIPEHLCYFLQNFDSHQDLYAGHALKNEQEVFNSGAAGYILSRTSLQKLVDRIFFHTPNDPNCIIQGENKWLQGNPGLVTAKCLFHSLNTKAIDTRERGKYHRFHAYGIVRMTMGKVDGWYKNKHANLAEIVGFDDSYTTLLSGVDCCSGETISFHYVEFLETHALFQIRKALVQSPEMSDTTLNDLLLKVWPTDYKDLGGYSSRLPETTSSSWMEITNILRKISKPEYQMTC
jgi:hypothetical protein